MENYLYFAEADVETGADQASEAVTVPASSFLYADPTGALNSTFYFKSILGSDYGMQKIVLAHESNRNKDVIRGVLQCLNAHPHSGGFTIVANANAAALTTGVEYSPNLQDLVTGVTITEDTTGASPAGTHRGYKMPELHWGNASTALTSSLTLTKNTNYHSIAGNVAAALPAAAGCEKGAWITITYSTAIGASNSHVFTTNAADASYTLASYCKRVGGAVASGMAVSNGSSHNVLTMEGDTNGDGGIGTEVRFVNTTGATNGWAVEAVTLNQGNGTDAMASAFS